MSSATSISTASTSISTASTSISTASTIPDDSMSTPFCVLRRLHSRIQELKLEVAELMTCNANLNLKIATHTCRRKPCGAKAPLDKPPSGDGDSASQEATDLVEYIDASAKKALFIYLHLYSPYLLPGMFGKAKPAFKHNSLDRYADSVSLEEGQAADLYAAVPEEDHEFVSLHPFSHPVYAQKFKEHLTAHQGNLTKRACQVAPFLFTNEPDIPAGIFKASESKSRLDNERIRALTGYAAHRNPRWPRYAPVLYANESSHGEDFLLNPVVIQLGRGLLYGLSAAQSADAPADTLSFRSPNALSSVPELRATNGLMSTCGTMLRFLLSPDTEFSGSGTGPESKTSYITDHGRYHRLLVHGWDLPGTQRTVAHWNEMLFPTTATSTTTAASTGVAPTADDSEGEELIMQGLANINLQAHEDYDVDELSSPDTEDDCERVVTSHSMQSGRCGDVFTPSITSAHQQAPVASQDSPSLITPATIASPSVTLSSIHQQAPVAIASSTPASLVTPATTGSTVAQALTTTSPSTGSSGGAPDPQPARHRATRATSAANNEENATASGSGSKASRGGKRGRGKRA
ncbi:hypothetical protein FA15DRAFT_660620 [Coprinopsis marcescibilis]|uniref:Uncharacterized protein n=1 Tax=Coprinopsis marcescibilis TaxID=230819 RepID=A0A5C3KFU4_COPMA|nr:hypothetical protein FA15DRAFT_660620 [Coprinopsis marcescibilis]